ncbi:MAG: hypothetical protein K9M96_18255 [Deltaproteobacteria bacterium]|nr:hypothetical protein [Deltaproteobacteria bacterium]
MKEIVALIVFLSFSIITTYLAANKLISAGLATVIYVFAILSGVAISNYDFIKRIKWKNFEIETFVKWGQVCS